MKHFYKIFLIFLYLSPILIILGFITLIVYLIVRRSTILHKHQILERWEVLIENGQGSAGEIYESIDAALTSVGPPGVSSQRKEIRAGGILKSKVYDGLVVTNPYLGSCRMYVIAYDYGTSLHIAWLLTMQLGWLKHFVTMNILKVADPRSLIRYLDIPRELELSAYVTTVHTATKKAAKALMERLKQDFSRIDTKSKGFLEVW